MSPWNNSESYEAEPEDEKMPLYVRVFWGIVIILILCAFYIGIVALANKARAHVTDHPEWTDELMQAKNQYGSGCCGMGDIHLLDYDEWRPAISGYEVMVHGEWLAVPLSSLTFNSINPTAHALLWYAEWDSHEGGRREHGITIYCFKPLLGQ